jgi:hypothetical protein
VDQWLRGVAEEMKNDIVLSFGTSPAGRTYQRGRRTHVASQPGFPPNVDLGALRASMHVEPAGKLSYHIADGVEYGIDLEDGRERIAPRPFVQPVFSDWQKKIAADAKRNLKLE